MVRKQLVFYQKAALITRGYQLSSSEESLSGTSLAKQDYKQSQYSRIQFQYSLNTVQLLWNCIRMDCIGLYSDCIAALLGLYCEVFVCVCQD